MELTNFTLQTKTMFTFNVSECTKKFMPEYHDRKSYTALHSLNNQETPNQMFKYKHALLQYKSIHQDIPYIDFIDFSVNKQNW